MALTKKQIKGIRCAKEWQLSDYAWNEPQKKMIKKFINILKKKLRDADNDRPKRLFHCNKCRVWATETINKLAGGLLLD